MIQQQQPEPRRDECAGYIGASDVILISPDELKWPWLYGWRRARSSAGRHADKVALWQAECIPCVFWMNMLQPDPLYDQLLIIYSQIRPASERARACGIIYFYDSHKTVINSYLPSRERGYFKVCSICSIRGSLSRAGARAHPKSIYFECASKKPRHYLHVCALRCMYERKGPPDMHQVAHTWPPPSFHPPHALECTMDRECAQPFSSFISSSDNLFSRRTRLCALAAALNRRADLHLVASSFLWQIKLRQITRHTFEW